MTLRLAPVVALLLLAGCGLGGDVRSYLRDELGTPARAGETETWQSREPVGTLAARIADEREPLVRRADSGNEYLRYDDDIVVVQGAAGGGSTVVAEDLDGRYRTGAFAFLGAGFSPGSPVPGDGGPGDGK